MKPLTKTIKDTSETLTKTNTETYFNNNKAIENFYKKVLKFMNDRGMITPFLASSLVNHLKTKKVNLD